jgi:hypothetical protein
LYINISIKEKQQKERAKKRTLTGDQCEGSVGLFVCSKKQRGSGVRESQSTTPCDFLYKYIGNIGKLNSFF